MTIKEFLRITANIPEETEIVFVDATSDILEPVGVTAAAVVYNKDKDSVYVAIM